jgi:hypothetical protein
MWENRDMSFGTTVMLTAKDFENADDFKKYALEGEEEMEVEIEGSPLPYTPARTYGPIDQCYPAEGGYCEDVQIMVPTPDKERQSYAKTLDSIILDALKTKADDKLVKRLRGLKNRIAEDDLFPLLTKVAQERVEGKLNDALADSE